MSLEHTMTLGGMRAYEVARRKGQLAAEAGEGEEWRAPYVTGTIEWYGYVNGYQVAKLGDDADILRRAPRSETCDS